MQAVSRLWKTADNLTRGALLLAIASVIVNIGTFLGLSVRGVPGWPYLIHVLLMILGFWVFGRTGAHVWKGVFGSRPEPVPWDRFLVLCTAISLAYVALLTAAELSTWGEGGAVEQHGRYFWQRNGSVIRELTEDEYRAFWTGFLRAFSAGWLFFALALATWNHNLLYRRRRHARVA